MRAAADDPVFLDNFSRILSAYDAYHSERAARGALTGLSADDLKAITQGIDARLQGVERLYRVALTNGDEPDFVFSVYRGAE